jgi:nuclear pore complex protein Nup107
MASSSTYSTFAKVITSYHEQYGSTTSSIAGPSKSPLDAAIRYDIVLDEEGGLVRSLMDAVEETWAFGLIQHDWLANDSRIKSRTADDGGGMDEEEQEALLREHRTWQLLRAVYEYDLRVNDKKELIKGTVTGYPGWMKGSYRLKRKITSLRIPISHQRIWRNWL